ncbi:MAG: hypothetical protein KA735_15360 [Burkholderiaceae bacterium]|nr:hypothetical protein [Burkholderiaceae bacterium]
MAKKKSLAKSATTSVGSGALLAGAQKTAVKRADWHVMVLVLLAVLLGGVAGTVGASWWSRNNLDGAQQVEQLQHELLLSEGNLIQVQAKLDVVLANVAVEASTRKALETTLQDTQAELGQVRDQLAFFNQLFPPGPAGAVSIRALDIQQAGPNLQYRALLMRSGATGTHFKGQMQFVAKGLQDGKAVKIDLQAAQMAIQAETSLNDAGFPLDFDQFQRSGGLLSLPTGFIAQTITLNILEGSTVRVSRTVSLPAPD